MHLSETRHNKENDCRLSRTQVNTILPAFLGKWAVGTDLKNSHQVANFKVCSDGRFSLGINLFHGISRVDDPAIACQGCHSRANALEGNSL